MARKALLIGTKTYQDGFKPLNSAPCDVEALAELLRHPEIGGFQPDAVEILIDQDSSALSAKIESWYLQHEKDDFALLFIAGHGVKDGDRKLHFAATNTRKVGEQLITATAVAAGSLSDWIRRSKAKRQIVILNCCFSGAFGDLVPMDEGTIDMEEVLGAEGRVVMTSTSSMDYAFERQNGEFSVYGHYLIEGIRTGAAAAQGSDEITVGELHHYVSRKVQEEASAMVPKIFAKGEAHRLRIAKVAIGDPEVKYRKKLEEILQEDGDEVDEVFSRPILNELGEKLNLTAFTMSEIEMDVLEPIRQRNAKRQKYVEFFQRAVQHRYPFGEREQNRISEYRKMLGLVDADYLVLEGSVLRLQAEIATKAYVTAKSQAVEDSHAVESGPNEGIDSIPLESAKGIDYRNLRDLLKAGKWEEADKETYRLMITTVGKREGQYFDCKDLENFPCADLLTLDQLWGSASNGHFGFSVQKKIWEECGSPMSYSDEWEKFGDRVGWRRDGDWLKYSDFHKNPALSPVGELPARGRWGGRGEIMWVSFLAQRLVNCSTPQS